MLPSAALVIVLLFMLFIIVCAYYYQFIVRPYSNIPFYQLDVRILYWMFMKKRNKDIPFLSYVFQRGMDICRKYQDEGIVVLRIGKPYVLVFGEEIVKHIVNEPAATDKSGIYRVFRFFLGNGLFTSNGNEWKKHRKIVNPSFHGLLLKDKVGIMNEYGTKLVANLKDTKGLPTDKALDFVQSVSVKIFFDSTIGMKLEKSQTDSKVRTFINSIRGLSRFSTTRIFSPWLQYDILLPILPYTRKGLRLEKQHRHFIMEQMRGLIDIMCIWESTEKQDITTDFTSRRRIPFAQSLIHKHFKDPSFTLDDLYYQYATPILAGFETISLTVVWCLLMLGLHPEIQEQAYNELKSVVSGDTISYEEVKDLTYLDCIIKETLRVYPVAPIFGRRLTKDLQIGKYKIPKNSDVVVCIYLLHRNPDIYPDPEKFDPERFRDGVAKEKPWAFIPFAEGIRPCIGKSYADLQIKILLFHILKMFKVVSLDSREDVPISWEMLLACAKKPRMQFIARDS